MSGVKRVSFQALGTQVEILLPTTEFTREEIDDAVTRARDKIECLEALLSRFRSDSDVSRINAAPGQWVHVAPATVEVLLLAKDAFERSHGLFHPCLGHRMERIGYHVSFDELVRRPSYGVADEAPYLAPVSCPFEVDAISHAVRLTPGYKVDLGGIAKGWIVQQAANVLYEHSISQFVLNAGGDMVCAGWNGHRPWYVGVANPFDSAGGHVLTLDVSNTSVATSATHRRAWTHNGHKVHHILDPFLGLPSASDVVSCTVVHPDLVEAEVVAKVALLLGSKSASSWLRQKEAVTGWVLILSGGEVIHSWNS
jgi:FAD:protein FMN transferase